MQIEIDPHSGFCFGVTRAIGMAEEELRQQGKLYCLGDIVHNNRECERLEALGLYTIDHQRFATLHGERVLFRAHGEPPATYRIAKKQQLHIVDATCTVVLQLQKRIKQQYAEHPKAQIVIFGKAGHAEVLGLVGQTDGHAIVVEDVGDVMQLDFQRDIYLYSQTTKSLDDYQHIIQTIRRHLRPGAEFHSFDTICRQVANRIGNIAAFAAEHQLVLFVSGNKSSNGKVLFAECQRVNANSRQIERPDDIQPQWLGGVSSVGICGATSTPKWLMEQCKTKIQDLLPTITHI